MILLFSDPHCSRSANDSASYPTICPKDSPFNYSIKSIKYHSVSESRFLSHTMFDPMARPDRPEHGVLPV